MVFNDFAELRMLREAMPPGISELPLFRPLNLAREDLRSQLELFVVCARVSMQPSLFFGNARGCARRAQ